jgi:hypothetical protein
MLPSSTGVTRHRPLLLVALDNRPGPLAGLGVLQQLVRVRPSGALTAREIWVDGEGRCVFRPRTRPVSTRFGAPEVQTGPDARVFSAGVVVGELCTGAVYTGRRDVWLDQVTAALATQPGGAVLSLLIREATQPDPVLRPSCRELGAVSLGIPATRIRAALRAWAGQERRAIRPRPALEALPRPAQFQRAAPPVFRVVVPG